MADIKNSVEKVLEKVIRACERVGRNPEQVKIVAVSKTFPVEYIEQAYLSGILDFGENYIQEAFKKMEKIGLTNINWHFVGHLQTNKAKYISRFHLFHSADSIKLLDEIERRAEKEINFLIQINIGEEKSKYGIGVGEILKFVEDYISKGYKRLNLKGLMTIPPISVNPDETRQYFRKMAQIRGNIEDRFNLKNLELSMGMSDDFEIAVEEGATILRIGRAIFGERG